MTYELLQQYWWFLVSLLGALLVFLMFVQGANAVGFGLAKDEGERRMVLNSTGRKWEVTFTTLATFGGGFFASFPLFYSTSFGGAYWLWMLILFSFVVQAVGYEFQNKLGNLFGPKLFRGFLIFNGYVGPLLLGGAVATFFEGSNFVVDKGNILGGLQPVISHWANASHGLDALLNPWVLVFGLMVVFLTQTLGLLYMINNIDDQTIRQRAVKRMWGTAVPFVVLFLAVVARLLTKDGFAYDPATGVISMEPLKYLHNFLELWPLLVLFLVGTLMVLYGVLRTLFCKGYVRGIWPAGIGTVLVVLSLLLCAGLNNTAYYPSTADLQSSLTIANSCSSEVTLQAMAVVSIFVPIVLAYLSYVWHAMDHKKITKSEMTENGDKY